MSAPERERLDPFVGLHTENARDVIVRTDAASFSTLKHFAKSAAHAYYAIQHPKDSTPAMDAGNALHLAVLEPERFADEVVAAPVFGDLRTPANKARKLAWEAENAGKLRFQQEAFDAICWMRDAVWNHPIAAEMLRGPGHNEVGAVWLEKTQESGTAEGHCKALIDRIGVFDKWTWLLDLKSCADASPEGFVKAIANQHYHVQAAMILDGCNAIEQRDRRFGWIAVENVAPHCVAVYEPDMLMLAVGRERFWAWLRRYTEAKKSGAWPGYPRRIRALALPKWAQGETPGE